VRHEASVELTFFATPTEFEAWLADHHRSESDLWVGFYKKDSGRPSITWPEAVDEALCVGWIDGVRKRIDDVTYAIRFTPRKPRSIWSAVNLKRVAELSAQRRMRPAGIEAFGRRTAHRSVIYSYEQKQDAELDARAERAFRAKAKAWKFFQAQPPSYKKTCIWWVISAKREETRQRRLDTLIDASARGQTIR
jgi:uncharacterized protein YdeI (YjbR/CyaY-like superfamily)